MNLLEPFIGIDESRGGNVVRSSISLSTLQHSSPPVYVLRLSNNQSVAVQQLVLVAFCSQAQLTLFFASGHFTFPV